MELLLNLAWLLLALPACWLWRVRKRPHTYASSAAQFAIVLGCMLVVLFPVISATDDLCAISAECEESPTGKHSLRQASHDRLSGWKWQTQPALVARLNFCTARDYAGYSQPGADLLTTRSHGDSLPARAPPSNLS